MSDAENTHIVCESGWAGVLCDKEAPVVKLNGASEMSIFWKTNFKDPGATSSGGEKVVITGLVDPFTPGTNTRTYTAKNKAGFVGTASRTVIVQG